MKKKMIIIVGSLICVCLIGAGIWFGITKMNKSQVKVFAVNDLAQGFMGNEMNLSGMILSDVSQDVHLTDKQIVEEVFVKEGDQVEVGDPLLSYDMTLVNIDLEMEKINKESIDIKIKGLKQEIQKIKDTQTVSKSTGGEDASKVSSQGEGHQAIPMNVKSPLVPLAQETPVIPQGPSDAQDPSGSGDAEKPEEPEDPKDTPGNPNDTQNPSDTEKINAVLYDALDENSIPYKGTGTKTDPFVFLCSAAPRAKGSFLNKLGGFGQEEGKTLPESFALLEVREDNVAEGLLLYAMLIDGRKVVDKTPADQWFDLLLGVEQKKIEEEEQGSFEEQLPEGDDPYLGDIISGDEIINGYTKEEKEKLIGQKEQEIKGLQLDSKESDLKIEKINNKLQNQTINSTIEGTVKSVGDPKKGEIDGSPFIQVISSEGLYVKGSVSELQLGEIKAGQHLSGTSMEGGSMFEAEIREISPYPTSNNYFGGQGNQNVSYYPFTAYIANGEGLKNQEYVNLFLNVENAQDMNALYIPKAFIREEDGKPYVYMADEKSKLKKQYISSGKTMYGYVTEIKSGITRDDKLAFPYGKGVKDGTKTKDASMDELYY